MLFGEPPAIAERIRAEVEREVGVTCSVGVAPTKFVAKLASDHCKPDGMLVVPADGVLGFLEPLPVGRLWGVGEKTGEVLSRLAVRTVGDLAATPEAILARLLGEQQRPAPVRGSPTASTTARSMPYEAPKSVGHEETFEHDLDDDETLLRELLALSGKVASRLRADGYRARTVTMKVRLATFTTLTRSKTLPEATDVGADLYHTVAELYRALPGERRRVRLLGVQASGLVAAGAEQLAMLRGERWGDVERAVDRIELRFGRGAAMPASLLDRSRPRATRLRPHGRRARAAASGFPRREGSL